MGIKEFIEKVKSNEIDIVEHTYKVLEECKELNKEYNYLNNISEDLALNSARKLKIQLKQKNKNIKNKKLLGIPISVKDNICVKNVETTAGSKILQGYNPLFDAFAVQKSRKKAE